MENEVPICILRISPRVNSNGEFKWGTPHLRIKISAVIHYSQEQAEKGDEGIIWGFEGSKISFAA